MLHSALLPWMVPSIKQRACSKELFWKGHGLLRCAAFVVYEAQTRQAVQLLRGRDIRSSRYNRGRAPAPRRAQRRRLPLPLARMDIDLRRGGRNEVDVPEGPHAGQPADGGILRDDEDRDVSEKGLGGGQPGRTRGANQPLSRLVHHQKAEAAAWRDEPDPVQAKPEPGVIAGQRLEDTEKRYHPPLGWLN